MEKIKMTISQIDKISLMSSIYQSGSTVDAFIRDFDRLSKVLDGNRIEEIQNDNSACQTGFGTTTQKIIDTWSILLLNNSNNSNDNLDGQNPQLHPYQEKFLYKNEYSKNSLPIRDFHLGSKGAGITTIYSIHASRTLMTNPNLEIQYYNSSNEKLEIFIDAISSLLPKDMIQSKTKLSIKLSNGSGIRAENYQNFVSKIENMPAEFTTNQTTKIKKIADTLVDLTGKADVIFYDNSEDVPFKNINEIIEYGCRASQMFISGHAKTTNSLPYRIITDYEYSYIKKHIIPWWEIDGQNQIAFDI